MSRRYFIVFLLIVKRCLQKRNCKSRHLALFTVATSIISSPFHHPRKKYITRTPAPAADCSDQSRWTMVTKHIILNPADGTICLTDAHPKLLNNQYHTKKKRVKKNPPSINFILRTQVSSRPRYSLDSCSLHLPNTPCPSSSAGAM